MNTICKVFWMAAALLFAAMSLDAAEPCCSITGIDQRAGVVTARETATGRVFQFRPQNAALLTQLKVGQQVYANFARAQVSVDGAAPCCTIVGTAAAAKPLAPCCAITGIDQRAGQVTARETATGRTFQFRPQNAGLLNQLKIGQAVYANFADGQVSVDGIAPCCGIVSGTAANPEGPCCTVVSINQQTGVGVGKNLTTGKTFQFQLQRGATLRAGDKIFVDSSTGQVSVRSDSSSGINRLIAVAQLKQQSANDAALHGAEDQKKIQTREQQQKQ